MGIVDIGNSHYGTATCVNTETLDVDIFNSSNKVPDAPIQPVTNGTAQSNAENNYQRIQWCLTKYKKAVLKSTGDFVINKHLLMDNATLTSESLNWPVIKMAYSVSPENSVIKMYGNSRVSFLTINGNNFSVNRPVPCVIAIIGNNNKIDNNWILGGSNVLQPASSEKVTGVYLLCGENNLIQNNKITNNHYGVIATNETENITSNIIDQNDIFMNRCDAITLVKYAKVTSNKIHSNGWDCQNGGPGMPPVPGGGIYSNNNKEGAYIKDNEVYDNNGHNIDLINVSNFQIYTNTVYNPGNKYFPGCGYSGNMAPAYGNAISICLVNISNSTIEGNIVRNENRSFNAVNSGYYGTDPNGFFSALNAVKFSDLPFGGNSVIAFCMAETDSSKFIQTQISPPMIQTQQNIIRNNTFIASPNGIGYFTSRNTGFDKDQSWSASTTNYFTLNNPTGSNHGSRRCGGNWFAADHVNPNTDDAQHVPPGSNWTGSDNRNFY